MKRELEDWDGEINSDFMKTTEDANVCGLHDGVLWYNWGLWAEIE